MPGRDDSSTIPRNSKTVNHQGHEGHEGNSINAVIQACMGVYRLRGSQSACRRASRSHRATRFKVPPRIGCTHTPEPANAMH